MSEGQDRRGSKGREARGQVVLAVARENSIFTERSFLPFCGVRAHALVPGPWEPGPRP